MTKRANRRPNHLLWRARLERPSSHNPELPTSRQELADAVNAWLGQHFDNPPVFDENHVGKLERGEVLWPRQESRQAFRAVLGAASDADLGFYNSLGRRLRAADLAALAGCGQEPPPVRPPESSDQSTPAEAGNDAGSTQVITVPITQRWATGTHPRFVTTVTITFELDNNAAPPPEEQSLHVARSADGSP